MQDKTGVDNGIRQQTGTMGSNIGVVKVHVA